MNIPYDLSNWTLSLRTQHSCLHRAEARTPPLVTSDNELVSTSNWHTEMGRATRIVAGRRSGNILRIFVLNMLVRESHEVLECTVAVRNYPKALPTLSSLLKTYLRDHSEFRQKKTVVPVPHDCHVERRPWEN